MTGPTPLAELARTYIEGAMQGQSARPDRQIAAAQVLATLELADAVRSTDPPVPHTVLSVTGKVAERVVRPFCEAKRGDLVCSEPNGHKGSHWANTGSGVGTWSQ